MGVRLSKRLCWLITQSWLPKIISKGATSLRALRYLPAKSTASGDRSVLLCNKSPAITTLSTLKDSKVAIRLSNTSLYSVCLRVLRICISLKWAIIII